MVTKTQRRTVGNGYKVKCIETGKIYNSLYAAQKDPDLNEVWNNTVHRNIKGTAPSAGYIIRDNKLIPLHWEYV